VTDWDAEGLLDGLETEAERAGRRELLGALHGEGVPVADLRRAIEEDRLALVRVERLLLGEKRYTLRDIAERTGLDLDYLTRYRRILGLAVPHPDERASGEADLEDALRGKALRDAGIDDERMHEMERVLARGLAQYAAAFRVAFAEGFLQAGDTELEVADRYAAAFQALEPLAGPHLAHVFFVHLRELVAGDVISAEERRTGRIGGREQTAIAFADVVGFTELGESAGHEELGSVAARLDALAAERVRAPVRLAKTIGDALMLVAPKPAPLVATVLELVESAEAAGLPPLRGGVAYGPAVNRWGDWYGSTVNLASRLTGRARPATVLVSEPVREAAPGCADWSFAGEKRFKGFSAPVKVHRARRPAADVA